ncbi:hypothetical protein TrLO_g10234 [Triparma laevis f. longispina]|uniref:ABC transporter domain-containing protein n=1 Tax=Triparma laevis f. longispina TaxID=1714387 RepID=A0A9W6ZIJ5_9STRA|nr:hypothetical protein TrLO_g10234 [Triparma laevis f. longispina]
MASTFQSIGQRSPSGVNTGQRRSSVLSSGTTFSWSDVSFSVNKNSTKAADTESTVILDKAYGTLMPGTLTAILGPSGSGKSSLLNILAGRVTNSAKTTISGTVLVNNSSVDPVENRANVAYVLQDDCLPKTTTPKEALMFSASLRLGVKVTQKEKKERVDNMLEELGLVDCQNTLVGDDLTKGISGGERKRTAIGVELVTQPDLVFLDEPTSGLDSYAAWRCVTTLKKISREDNATILATIHQPSSEIFQQFDNVIVLGKRGRVVFSGPVEGLSEHFAKKGYPNPPDTNPSDHALFVIMTSPVDDQFASGLYDNDHDNANGGGNNSNDGSLKEVPLKEASVGGSIDEKAAPGVYIPLIEASFFKQFRWLLKREIRCTYRDAGSLIGRFGGTIFLNILFGLIFLDAGRSNDANTVNFNNHFGSLTLVTISAMFGTASPALLQFPAERPVFLREYSTGTYTIIPYLFSKMAVEAPLLFTQSLCQTLCTYFLIGFQGNFGLFVTVFWLLGLASNSVAICAGCVVDDVKKAAELTPLIFVPQLLFSGFFVAINAIPVWLRWAQWLCSLKYTLNLLLLIEFNNDVCGASPGAQANCNSLFARNDIQTSLIWFYILILMCLFLGFRFLGGLLLINRSRTVF